MSEVFRSGHSPTGPGTATVGSGAVVIADSRAAAAIEEVVAEGTEI
jgi:hypothetical protein